jgi:hypothetical protein
VSGDRYGPAEKGARSASWAMRGSRRGASKGPTLADYFEVTRRRECACIGGKAGVLRWAFGKEVDPHNSCSQAEATSPQQLHMLVTCSSWWRMHANSTPRRENSHGNSSSQLLIEKTARETKEDRKCQKTSVVRYGFARYVRRRFAELRRGDPARLDGARRSVQLAIGSMARGARVCTGEVEGGWQWL